MAEKRYSQNNKRLCDERKCENEATHTLVWTEKWQCYCEEHARGMANIGAHLGFMAPRMTLREMDAWEKVKHE